MLFDNTNISIFSIDYIYEEFLKGYLTNRNVVIFAAILISANKIWEQQKAFQH